MTPASLKNWRKQLGYSRAAAARELGCAVNSIRAWETGQKIPRYIELACIAISNGYGKMTAFW